MIDEMADPKNAAWASKTGLDPMVAKQGEATREAPPIAQLVMHDYQLLLGRTLDVLTTAVPNKQQHEAARHMVRKAFDETYFKILSATHPDSTFGAPEDSYAVEPLR